MTESQVASSTLNRGEKPEESSPGFFGWLAREFKREARGWLKVINDVIKIFDFLLVGFIANSLGIIVRALDGVDEVVIGGVTEARDLVSGLFKRGVTRKSVVVKSQPSESKRSEIDSFREELIRPEEFEDPRQTDVLQVMDSPEELPVIKAEDENEEVYSLSHELSIPEIYNAELHEVVEPPVAVAEKFEEREEERESFLEWLTYFWEGLNNVLAIPFDGLRFIVDLIFAALTFLLGFVFLPIQRYLEKDGTVTKIDTNVPERRDWEGYWQTANDIAGQPLYALRYVVDLIFAAFVFILGYLLKPLVWFVDWLEKDNGSDAIETTSYNYDDLLSHQEKRSGLWMEREDSWFEATVRAIWNFIVDFVSVPLDFLRSLFDIVFDGLATVAGFVLRPVQRVLEAVITAVVSWWHRPVAGSQSITAAADSNITYVDDRSHNTPAFSYKVVPRETKILAFLAFLFCITLLTLLLEVGTGASNVVRPLRHFLGFFLLVVALLKIVNWGAWSKAYALLNEWASHHNIMIHLLPLMQLLLGLAFIVEFQMTLTLILTLLVTLSSAVGMAYSKSGLRGRASDAPYFHYFSWRDLLYKETLFITAFSILLLAIQIV